MIYFSFSDIVTVKHSYQDLSDEQQKLVEGILSRQIEVYVKNRHVGTPEAVSALIEHIQDTYDLALRSVGIG